MCLAHLDRCADMSRDTALRHALALPRLFGTEVAIEGKAEAARAMRASLAKLAVSGGSTPGTSSPTATTTATRPRTGTTAARGETKTGPGRW